MPRLFLPIPPTATQQQVAQQLSDAATDVIQKITNSATADQQSVGNMATQAVQSLDRSLATVTRDTQAAIGDLRAKAERARSDLQSTADHAVDEFRTLLNDALRLLGQLPTNLACGDVNGVPFYEPLGGVALFIKAVAENRNPIQVRLREPAVAAAFRDFVGTSQDEIARKARDKLIPKLPQVPASGTGGLNYVVDPASGGTAAAILAALPPAVWILLGIAVLVLAVAVSVFVVLMAVAILFAIYKGYDIDSLQLDFSTPLAGVSLEIKMSQPA